jgi:hypothetical protein
VGRNLASVHWRAIVRADDGAATPRRKNDAVAANDDPLQRAPRARVTLLMLTALSALAFMDRQILAVLLVPVKAEFGLTDLQVGLVTGLGFALAFGAIARAARAVLADRRERRTLGGLVPRHRRRAGRARRRGQWQRLDPGRHPHAGSAISDAGGGPASLSMIADLYPACTRVREP